MMRKILFLALVLLLLIFVVQGVKIEKELLYNRHTLGDTYNYGKGERCFQWKRISNIIDSLQIFEGGGREFGALSNYKNRKGLAPLVMERQLDKYGAIQDIYGVKRDQSVPFYHWDNLAIPKRYGRDGSLVLILKDTANYLLVTPASFGGKWLVPSGYVDRLNVEDFKKLIFVDRTNQNSATMEQGDTSWLVRSMNPISTGLQRPPYKRETPAGVFVVRGKLEAMPFLRDGTIEAGGFAPWASRFCGGAYLHGVPVNYPDSVVLEYSGTLGTTPRSHMCVRNATSHAKFIYDWAPIGKALVVVFD
ncbi:MAG: L,D-transpeptidase [Odoribacter sp.]